jgi:hypothetical protein
MDEGVETAFLGTRTGLMRVQRYAGIEKRVAKWVHLTLKYMTRVSMEGVTMHALVAPVVLG